MYKCKFFKIQELVHPDFLKEYNENTLWKLFDVNLLKSADYIRENYGTIIINNYKIGLLNCGLRKIDSKVGSKLSPHKFGRALDLHILSIEDKKLEKQNKILEYNKVRSDLINNENNPYKNIINFENNVSWLHIDTYNRHSSLFNV